ncbi:hypothetical protein BpHYR1_051941 [Brachionus plicatilis]|uniref:Uncharacterized protein n=1 Tax=Brachionus plicatilis TaxID=10195 RepID=A0A3M7R0G6_BRAPC|nr:hypothetical protein BpHYR1_051941 [Brachionus plicatilis]
MSSSLNSSILKFSHTLLFESFKSVWLQIDELKTAKGADIEKILLKVEKYPQTFQIDPKADSIFELSIEKDNQHKKILYAKIKMVYLALVNVLYGGIKKKKNNNLFKFFIDIKLKKY